MKPPKPHKDSIKNKIIDQQPVCELIYANHNINRLKDKSSIIISLNTDMSSDKTPTSFCDKSFKRNQRYKSHISIYFNKKIYNKPTVNIIFNGEKLEEFPVKLGTLYITVQDST